MLVHIYYGCAHESLLERNSEMEADQDLVQARSPVGANLIPRRYALWRSCRPAMDH